MNDKQIRLISELCEGNLDRARFLVEYGIEESEVPLEVAAALRHAAAARDPDGVDDALTLGFRFSMPKDILGLLHELVVQDWHSRHEDMIVLLQENANAESVSALRQAIMLKPKLDYLDYDDYGSYYKKCLWALQAIGTAEAISVISECRAADDPALEEQAEYRLAKIASKNEKRNA